ncbi:MAG TPA: mechanosensitive ion channel family protein [Thiobacillus sp.]|nr:mechanosensitive ion channel family protein [Thiobacillus sp.]
MPRKARLANCGVVVTVQGGKAQLFCGAAEFTCQWLSAMQFDLGTFIESLVGKYRSRNRDPAAPSESVPAQRLSRSCHKLFLRAVLLGSVCCVLPLTVVAQEPVGKAGEAQKLTAPAKQELSLAPAKVDVKPVAHDEEIRMRLQRVLDATDWFTDPQVRVEEGVVFLNGKVESDELKKWAGDLAHNTQDVVAVANRLQVTQQSVWDFRQAWGGVMLLQRDFIRALPLLVFALLILALSVGSSLLTIRGVQALLRPRVRTKLLQNVIARTVGGLVLICGVYLILRVSGLTQLALTLVGGTGLVGLIIGIAFRDITENFLASIFLSTQPPFETGDLVEISGVTGYVQQLNMRTTILMTLDGNHVQIPNANVYKAILSNFTTNANRREEFIVGIGYDDAINEAQEIAREVLANHPAVLSDPEPAVLADNLGAATVNLRVYFWINGREYSWLKVRSSVIRLVKRAFQEHGISMPDEAREVVFPQGIPITMLDGEPAEAHAAAQGKRFSAEARHEELDVVSTKAEAGLYSEATVIEEQARQAQPLKEEENLLPGTSATAAEKQAKESNP